MPAAVAACGIAAGLLIAPRGSAYAARLQPKHTKIARTITTLADAVEDTEHVLVHRSGLTTVLGAVAYLGFEVLILWLALLAVHTHPTPGFAIVVMAYIIGALGGSLPLPRASARSAGSPAC